MGTVYTVFSVLATLAGALLVVVLLLNRLAPLTAARLGMELERWRAGLRLKRVAVPGFVMPYLEGGRGTPLVLVHGFGGDKDNFTRIARYLTPHYHVVIPDLPGFGEATRDAAASYTIAEQVERLRAFLDQVAPGPVHLGGNSMGGFIAAQFAATYPQRVASLWLLDPAGTAAAQSSAVLERYRDTGDMPLLLRQPGDVQRLIASTTHREPFLPYCVRTWLGRRGAADLALHQRIMHQLTTAPLLEQQYRELAPPALIVWGQQDRILHPSGAAALGALFRRSRTILMPGIGHLPMLEAPRQSARDYLAFRRESAPA
ncbi:alpha/beta fold hydrolase [Duganella sp. LX20W]|uniref:Alpha/beta fold hydrolase n=1 Tax=Rugamonas brunnea TaxID=2758569 RepID=A0A7W2IED8_9BURK|nr:alpha/beta fold hydrolase [Rugamonas brunnea]MBA5640230.1 alpha/beta fold hydrolase [Rugamonas brunnea]